MTGKQMRINRRMFLRQSAWSVLAAGLWPGARTAGAAAGNAKADPFAFAVLNDTHYRDARCGEYLTEAFGQILAHKENPELVLLAGDLATDGRRRELGPMKDLLGGLKRPVHVAIGNHDYEKDKSRKVWEDVFANRLNYVIEHRRWYILCYDSTLNVEWKNVAVQPETLAWLDKTLARLDRGKPIIALTHFPLGDNVSMRSANAELVLRRFENHNLRAVFTGHFHGLTERTYKGTPVCTNRCLAFSRNNHDGSKEKGYWLADATPDKVGHKFVEFLPKG